MANDKVYKSNVSGIRILRYLAREPRNGEDADEIPGIYLLVWNGELCGTTSFSSFFEAWSEVQAIDREQLAAMISWDAGESKEHSLDFPAYESLDDTLKSFGIDRTFEVEYDFDASVEELKAEIANALKASVESPPAVGGIEPEMASTRRKTFKL